MNDPVTQPPAGTRPPWHRSRAVRRYAIVVVAAYSPLFLDQVQAGNVAEIASTDTGSIQGVFRKPVQVPGVSDPVTDFQTQVPSFADDTALSADLAEGNVTVNASPPDNGPGLLVSLLVGFGPVLLLIAAFVWLSRRASSLMGSGPLAAFSRARVRRVEGEATHTTFADVAGIDDAKDELAEIVDYLRRPERYRRLGGRVPRGVLLSSESAQRTLDREVRRIVATAREDALQLLRDERWRLDQLAAALLEHETLDQDSAYRSAGLEPPTRPVPFPVAA